MLNKSHREAMSQVEIGTYIREKREQLKVSQEAVAYELGMS